MISEHEATYGGVATRALSVSGQGPPFLCLHGYSDTADTWRLLLRELAGAGRSAIAVDMPGFGEADPLLDGEMLPQLDEFVADLLETHGGEGPPIVVGNSLGGVAALRAAQDPDLPLAAVVPISPAGLGHQPWLDLVERDPVVHRLLSLPVPIPRPILRGAIGAVYARFAVADPTRVDREHQLAYSAQYKGRGDLARFARDGRRLLRELRSAYELERVCRPVLLIWGERDLLTPSTGADRLIAAVPETRLVCFEDCGHCAQLECPDRVAELVIDLDAEVRRRSRRGLARVLRSLRSLRRAPAGANGARGERTATRTRR